MGRLKKANKPQTVAENPIDIRQELKKRASMYGMRVLISKFRARPLDTKGLVPEDEETRNRMLLLAFEDQNNRSVSQSKNAKTLRKGLSRKRILQAVDECAEDQAKSSDPISMQGWVGKIAIKLQVQLRSLNKALDEFNLTKDELRERWKSWMPEK